jgi:hypothetical protein
MAKMVKVTFEFEWDEATGTDEQKRLAYAAFLRDHIDNSSDDEIETHVVDIRAAD